MKKTIFTVLTFSLLALGLQSARAGDREWALAGKVLTGVAAAAVISQVVQPAPVYASCAYGPGPYRCPAPVYRCAPRPVVVYAPARPVIVYRAPVFVARAPVVSFRFAVGGGAHHHRGRW